MQYVYARAEEEFELMIIRSYVSDALMACANNTARFAGGMTIGKRYSEICGMTEKKETESAEDIINRVINNGRLEVKTS